MKSIVLILGLITLLGFLRSYSQDALPLSKESIKSKGEDFKDYPFYINTGKKEYDRLSYRYRMYNYVLVHANFPVPPNPESLDEIVLYNKRLSEWNIKYDKYSKEVNIFCYSDFVNLKAQAYNMDITDSYPPPPLKSSFSDDKLYDQAIKEWESNKPNKIE